MTLTNDPDFCFWKKFNLASTPIIFAQQHLVSKSLSKFANKSVIQLLGQVGAATKIKIKKNKRGKKPRSLKLLKWRKRVKCFCRIRM